MIRLDIPINRFTKKYNFINRYNLYIKGITSFLLGFYLIKFPSIYLFIVYPGFQTFFQSFKFIFLDYSIYLLPYQLVLGSAVLFISIIGLKKVQQGKMTLGVYWTSILFFCFFVILLLVYLIEKTSSFGYMV